jgi:hypothetical protein
MGGMTREIRLEHFPQGALRSPINTSKALKAKPDLPRWLTYRDSVSTSFG